MQTARLFVFLLPYLTSVVSAAHRHPLDPLTSSEIADTTAIVKRSALGHKNLTFHYVGLDEPDKQVVLSWLSDQARWPEPPRRAFVVLRSERRTHELVVDLDNHSIVSDQIYSGPGYPMLTFEEQAASNALPLGYNPFIASMRKRGLDLAQVVCESFSVG